MAVKISVTMGCTLGTMVVTGEVVLEPETEDEMLRDRTYGVDEPLEDNDIIINLVRGGEGGDGAAVHTHSRVWMGSVVAPGTFSKPEVLGPS